MSLVGLVSCITATVWLVLEGYIKGRPLTEQELAIQTCNAPLHGNTTGDEAVCANPIFDGNSTMNHIEDMNTQEPKDYTTYLAALTTFIALFNIPTILFFNAPFKRKMANIQHSNEKLASL